MAENIDYHTDPTNKVAGNLLSIISSASEALDEMSVIRDGIADLLSKIDNLESSLSSRRSNHADDLRSLIGLYRTREAILNIVNHDSVIKYADRIGGNLMRQGITDNMFNDEDRDLTLVWEELEETQRDYYRAGAARVLLGYAAHIRNTLKIGTDGTDTEGQDRGQQSG